MWIKLSNLTLTQWGRGQDLTQTLDLLMRSVGAAAVGVLTERANLGEVWSSQKGTKEEEMAIVVMKGGAYTQG